MPGKTACVVGAGVSGIAALKECLMQGFKPVCYELDSDIGGIWHKKDHSQPTNTPAIWDGLITNTSKFNSCYSDFPPRPDDTPFLTAEAMFKYYKRAVEHYGLEQYLQFNTRVIKIRKTSDHDGTGQWEVFTTMRGDDIAGSDLAGPRGDDNSLSRCKREVFDVVLVCTGYFKVPAYPDIPGLDTFTGTVRHSFSFTSSKPYEGKNVLIVGNMLSAVDIASEVANYAQQVYIALGEGSWIIPRCFSKARSIDLLFPRSMIYSKDAVVKINNRLIQEAENKVDHKAAGIRPSKPPLFSAFGLNDELPMKLLSGRVQAYGRLIGIEGDEAQFQDGKMISGINAIVFCTGYKPDLSFIDLDLIQENGKMELYKMMFPLDQKHATLALITHCGGDSALAILAETQARLATRVMAGKQKLPPRDKMKTDADFWNADTLARRGKYGSYIVSTGLLTELIAVEIGCYPTFWKVFLRDPILAFRNWYGPILAAQYRLLGPDSQWDVARKSCYTMYEEGHSSIRHMEKKNFHRVDVHEYYKARIITLLALSTATLTTGLLFYKYQDTIHKHLLNIFS